MLFHSHQLSRRVSGGPNKVIGGKIKNACLEFLSDHHTPKQKTLTGEGANNCLEGLLSTEVQTFGSNSKLPLASQHGLGTGQTSMGRE